MIDKRIFVKGVTAAGFVFAARSALAQTYPAKVIRVISPAPAGSPPDIMARIVGNGVGQAEGWTIVTEDKPGGAMTLGAMEVLKLPADGYTLLTVSSPIVVATELVPNAHFNVETDFAPVIQIGSTYNVLVVNPSLPVKSLHEFIDYLKKSPGKYTFSSGGFGTPAHLLGEMFKQQTEVQTVHVPYQENGRAIADIINGTNTYQFITAVSVVDLIKSDKLRALVALSHNRVPSLPDVPTVVEEGYPNLASEDWGGILVKAGTPASVITALNSAMNKALQTEKVQQALTNLGTRVVGGTPAAFGQLIHEQVGHWTKVIKDAGIAINQ
ncbi:MAG: tripartite tricarboxylate transporter substrate binding protein [Xanthobacteraceae bacterium]